MFSIWCTVAILFYKEWMDRKKTFILFTYLLLSYTELAAWRDLAQPLVEANSREKLFLILTKLILQQKHLFSGDRWSSWW